MKINIVAVGKEKDFTGRDMVSDYVSRISHYYPVEMIYVAGDDKEDENRRVMNVLEKLGTQSFVVALDEKGKSISSKGLAGIMDKATNMGSKNIVFIIGGAYGIDENIKGKANAVISLSEMTFTHTMVRLIIAEQIYRACTIQRGEKYHHE